MPDPAPVPAPDPTPWPGHAPRPPGRQAPVGLAIASVCLAILVVVVELATAVAAFPATREFRESVELGGSPYEVFTAYDALELLLFPAFLAAYIVSCLWLQSSRSNAAAISPGRRPQRGPVWVWLGWWVPIVSLWFPYQVLRDVQVASRQVPPVISVGAWWGAWLAYLIGNRISANAASSTDIDWVAGLPPIEVGMTIIAAVACVLWCRLVLRITADQRAALAA